jgi:hypothetical protein
MSGDDFLKRIEVELAEIRRTRSEADYQTAIGVGKVAQHAHRAAVEALEGLRRIKGKQ